MCAHESVMRCEDQGHEKLPLRRTNGKNEKSIPTAIKYENVQCRKHELIANSHRNPED